MRVGLTLLFCAALGCAPKVEIVDGARITCARDEDCFSGQLCLSSERRCVDASSECMHEREAVPDGEPCGDDEVCVAGGCAASVCGDGYVDFLVHEQCEPGLGVDCRDDCTQRTCGDGILDHGETCDEGNVLASADCVSCLDACEPARPSTGMSDDLLCSGTPRALTTSRLFGAGEILDDVAYVATTTSLSVSGGTESSVDLLRVDLSSGAAEVLASDLYDASVVRDGSSVLVSTSADEGAALLRYERDGSAVSLRALSVDPLSEIVVVDEHVYVANYAGILRMNADGEMQEQWSDRCAVAFEMVRCGDEIVCVELPDGADFVSRVAAVSLADAAAREVTSGALLHLGCLDERLVWASPSALFEEQEPGRVVGLAVLPPSLPLLSQASLVSDGSRLAWSFVVAAASSGSTGYQTIRFDRQTGERRFIINGALLTLRDGRALYWTQNDDASEATLFLAEAP